MGLESGNNISNLNINWPLEEDKTHEGNEHLQLIKRVMQQTFPGRDGEGNPEGGWDQRTLVNPEELDHLIGLTANVQLMFDFIAAYLDPQTEVEEGDLLYIGRQDHENPGSPSDVKFGTKDSNGITQEWDDGASTAVVLNTVNSIDHIFPVGTILDYDENGPNPNTIYPGTTWEQITGTFSFASGTVDDGVNPVVTVNAGDIGGTYLHKLTEDEMPAHSHLISADEAAVQAGTSASQFLRSKYDGDEVSRDTGGDEPHQNMPPYLVVNRWRRTV